MCFAYFKGLDEMLTKSNEKKHLNYYFSKYSFNWEDGDELKKLHDFFQNDGLTQKTWMKSQWEILLMFVTSLLQTSQ